MQFLNHNKFSRSRLLSAFTLMELIVVIAIIGTVSALMAPTAMQVREAAISAVCMSNQRSIGVGDTVYRYNHNDWMVTMGLFAAPSPSGSSNNLLRPDEPSIYKELWPDGIRWCPSLTRGTGYYQVTGNYVLNMPATPPTISPTPWTSADAPPTSTSTPAVPSTYDWLPINYLRYCSFGYARPGCDEFVMYHYPRNRLYYENIFPNPRVWPTYIKMGYEGKSPATWIGSNYRPEGTRPMASDLIASSSAVTHTTAHNGFIAKTNGNWPRDPRGANSLWLDGSVTWSNFPGRENCYNNYKEVATGINLSLIPGLVPDQAWVRENARYAYYFPSRQSH